ncbi:putative alpha/beta hydrolase family protein [Gregarina niphandrodes]|uniref:Alpha/beta hydrolase family protein n=1 Tax=Gregarina niphandrodes TaxID=110365 RepID=A0A023BDF2_GRENI|nr:putative alpha/beta hydrolase family protein [Gregarina niphandrodes]EZG88492.1 putative alpha/beta hydrolase family protein [Gregarina niphandrodes]|eukprot:XP_011128553.1 putative alpha/beta hydrolase family protein [Gregarina niphandrodes]
MGLFFRSIVVPVVVIGIAILIALCFFQSKLIFVPQLDSGDRSPYSNPNGWRHPGEKGIPYEDIQLDTEANVTVHMWLMKQKDSRNVPTLIFYHGNAGNLGHRLPNLEQLYKRSKLNVLACSYRGYGLSTGIPSELGFFHDAGRVVEYLRTRDDIDSNRLYVFGRSLGGAVAIETARRNPEHIRGLIIENTFWDMRSMAVLLFRPLVAFGNLLNLLLQHKFMSGQAIMQVKQPILFLSGDEDTIVPPSQMLDLYKTARQSKFRHFVSIAGGSHNECWLLYPTKYYESIDDFIRAVEGNEGEDMNIVLGTKKKSPTEITKKAPEDQGNFFSRIIGLFTNEYNSKEL